MNIFVLCTGRCGSVTFSKACQHINNYTVAHESQSGMLATERLEFPDNHIEIDNRLSWMLGVLDEKYGNNAFYVHLNREKLDVAESFNRRWESRKSIIRSYSQGILMRNSGGIDDCHDYWETVNANIRMFLRNKTRKMEVKLGNISNDFGEFWSAIGADGNFETALAEWGNIYNPSKLNMV